MYCFVCIYSFLVVYVKVLHCLAWFVPDDVFVLAGRPLHSILKFNSPHVQSDTSLHLNFLSILRKLRVRCKSDSEVCSWLIYLHSILENIYVLTNFLHNEMQIALLTVLLIFDFWKFFDLFIIFSSTVLMQWKVHHKHNITVTVSKVY